MQIIHPVAYNDKNIRSKSNCFWENMTKVPITRLDYEEDYFPTAHSRIAELLRKNPNYDIKREAKDKIHITCRGQAILLASILKAKSIPARARSGFAPYIKEKDFELSEEEYKELDNLANLMLNPNENFEKLKKIWESTLKYRVLCGALNN